MHFSPQEGRDIIGIITNEIAVTKQTGTLTQEDQCGFGDGVIFESDSPTRQHPTTTTYERGGRF